MGLADPSVAPGPCKSDAIRSERIVECPKFVPALGFAPQGVESLARPGVVDIYGAAAVSVSCRLLYIDFSQPCRPAHLALHRLASTALLSCSQSWLHTPQPSLDVQSPFSRPPIMACVTPSPDLSPVSAATTNGHFPRDSFCLNISTLPDAGNFMLKSALKSPHLLESPNGFSPTSGFMTGSFKKRPRNMSQSSGTDREMSSDPTHPHNSAPPTSNGSEPRASNKKRPSTDTIDYPRRRATIAVRGILTATRP
jgi:hypothetical protein